MTPSAKHYVLWGMVIVGIGAICAANVSLAVSAMHRRDARITPASFRRVDIGMTRTELHDLLGSPGRQLLVFGKVNDPGNMTVHFSEDEEQLQKLRDSGYHDYILDVWFSPTATIQAYVDADDRVVCRRSTGGQDQTLLGRIWPVESVTLPTAD